VYNGVTSMVTTGTRPSHSHNCMPDSQEHQALVLTTKPGDNAGYLQLIQLSCAMSVSIYSSVCRLEFHDRWPFFFFF
jgi:hypothetical protein